VELILDAGSVLGEGAIWDEEKQVLYWVDIDPGLVHVCDLATHKDRSLQVGQPVGTVVPRASGGLMLAVRDGFMSLDLETGRTALVAVPPRHNPENGFNDGKCDPAGRFYARYKNGSELDHIGFIVDDAEKRFKLLVKRGARSAARPSGDESETLAYVKDPDGIWIELIGPGRKPKEERLVRKGTHG